MIKFIFVGSLSYSMAIIIGGPVTDKEAEEIQKEINEDSGNE